MDKELLRRLGWSEELIAAAEAAKRPDRPRPIAVGRFAIVVRRVAIGGNTLDVTSSPVVASSALAPPARGR
jgi:hypothetical protein